MSKYFDRIVIAVPDVEVASKDYAVLLGTPGMSRTVPRESIQLQHISGAAFWWPLANTVIELIECDVAAPQLAGFVLAQEDEQLPFAQIENTLGLHIQTCDGTATQAVRESAPSTVPLAVDHLVLRTDAPDACIQLFGETLGIRLALDKTVPEWGGRMLFFRTGQLTLEAIASDKEEEQDSGTAFWGVAIQCPALEKTAEEMRARGVRLSDVREGRKPGTRVATVESHCLEIPTLLIQPAE